MIFPVKKGTYIYALVYTSILSTNINYYRWWREGYGKGRGRGVPGNFLDYLFLAGHITPRYVLMYLSTFIKATLLLGIAQFGCNFGYLIIYVYSEKLIVEVIDFWLELIVFLNLRINFCKMFYFDCI